MAALWIGTNEGVFRLEPGGAPRREPGPPSAVFLAAGAEALYSLASDGALWALVRGAGWQRVNEQPVAEEVWAFAADPRLPGRLYLGVSPALLHRSDDGGARWAPCDSMRRIPGYERWTFPPPPHIPHVRAIVPDPRVAGGVYVGVEEGGVFRSPDGGERWESLNEGLYWDVHALAVAPDGERLYATTGAGFHRSDNGGRRWRRLMDGLDRGYTVALALAPHDRERVLVAAAATPPPGWTRGANAALYRSRDGGQHWERVEQGLPERFDAMAAGLAFDRDGAAHLAVGPAVYRSPDGGERWERVAGELPPARALALWE